MKKERQYDLQDRLVDYTVRIIKLSEALPDTMERSKCWILEIPCWPLDIQKKARARNRWLLIPPILKRNLCKAA